MRLDLAVAALAVSASTVRATVLRGTDPKDAHIYTPYPNQHDQPSWKCLDGSKEIRWSAVNDDFCDCQDGSDEPGTSACANSSFYCLNEGHVPARIRSSRVHDNICDPECCDGSDEVEGKCANRCEQVGREFRKRAAEQANLHRAGGKIREKYISEGRKAKEALQADMVKLEVELQVATEREEQLKRQFDRAQTQDKAVIDAKMATRLYKSLTTHQSALDALLKRNTELKTQLQTLTLMLDDLAKGYNPNNQDMAVKGAVVAYNEWRGVEQRRVDDLLDDGEWDQTRVSDLVKQDALDLMDGGLAETTASTTASKRASTPEAGLLFRIHEYLPDTLVPYFEAMVDTLLDVLLKANVITDVKRMRPKSSTEEPESVAAARTAHASALNRLSQTRSDLQSRQTQLDQFDTKYGRSGEFKTLENTCISKDMGEYTYEYCFFGQVKQIPNKGGSTVSLGTFANWNPQNDATRDQDRFWLQQVYARGQKCWNGPERSAIVDLQCDTTNAVLDVFEAEKCIYSIKISTPAVCFAPPSPPQTTIKDEL